MGRRLSNVPACCRSTVPCTDPATRWALIFGLMNGEDQSTGRKNLTMAIVGWFDGRTFSKEFEQELDFGTDNYAFQAFVDGDRLSASAGSPTGSIRDRRSTSPRP